MEPFKPNKKTTLAAAIIRCKCPRCRQGEMFVQQNPYSKGFMKMFDKCELCGQSFDLELGFYYGSSYVSYAFAISISAFSLVAWWLTIGLSITDNRIFYWMGCNAILLIGLQPVLMRIARTGWLNFFVHYDADWKNVKAEAPERMIKELQNAW